MPVLLWLGLECEVMEVLINGLGRHTSFGLCGNTPPKKVPNLTYPRGPVRQEASRSCRVAGILVARMH